jgi:hypothetical protein
MYTFFRRFEGLFVEAEIPLVEFDVGYEIADE